MGQRSRRSRTTSRMISDPSSQGRRPFSVVSTSGNSGMTLTHHFAEQNRYNPHFKSPPLC